MRWRTHLAGTSYIWFRTQPSRGGDCGGEPNDAKDGVDYGRRRGGEEGRRDDCAGAENGGANLNDTNSHEHKKLPTFVAWRTVRHGVR